MNFLTFYDLWKIVLLVAIPPAVRSVCWRGSGVSYSLEKLHWGHLLELCHYWVNYSIIVNFHLG